MSSDRALGSYPFEVAAHAPWSRLIEAVQHDPGIVRDARFAYTAVQTLAGVRLSPLVGLLRAVRTGRNPTVR